jgi:hypothetical protein
MSVSAIGGIVERNSFNAASDAPNFALPRRLLGGVLANCAQHLRQFDGRAYFHLFKNVRAVDFDGAHRDPEFVGNDLVQLAGKDLLHDLVLALGKLCQPVPD